MANFRQVFTELHNTTLPAVFKQSLTSVMQKHNKTHPTEVLWNEKQLESRNSYEEKIKASKF